jgi:predicted RNA methylase
VNDHAITVRLKDVDVERNELQDGVSIPEDTQTVLINIMKFLRFKRGL